MKTFFKDYWELSKESMRFFNKHWLGMLIMYVLIFGATFVGILIPSYSDEIKTKVKRLFHKNERES